MPVHVFVERRKNTRVSLLKDKIHLRLPNGMPAAVREAEMEQLLHWAAKRIEQKQMYRKADQARDYTKPYTMALMGEDWQVGFEVREKLRGFRATLNGRDRTIVLYGDPKLAATPVGRADIRELLIGIIRKSFLKNVAHLVSKINDKTIQKEVANVRLKDIRSRWGSCSVRKNINLSLRLLLLPEAVMQYVIIHELAHLVEMNHSARFWAIVERHMPEYRTHEKWLKKNGHQYDF